MPTNCSLARISVSDTAFMVLSHAVCIAHELEAYVTFWPLIELYFFGDDFK